ncbi:multidrug effflux MFS transporter [Pengzhenrongella sicca]|uniref:Multidrug effflux MFS transporter n=1 Tax=Pengzhenrongella sicca TaxID=2819238 RepID=A0A8A4ZD11_9MICO|nr:multidrug effflux MFS transporter [Pengzhenrongella sicca]QTE28773.1 multidrug effflux MFS transporter [Pengzhenrongella sicca]
MENGGPLSPPAPRSTGKYILLLGLMCALPAVTSDIYVPSLPDVARDLATSTTAVQLTMTGVLVGGAFGQLVVGPLSDRLGRRLPVLIGVAMHVLISLLCAVAPGIGWLITLRFLQGFFNASATVVALAVIRDRFVGADASRLLSRLMLVIGAAPMFAPSLGGVIAGQFGWRGVFVGLALFGAVLWVVVWRRLPETLHPEFRREAGLGPALRGYRELLRDRHFVAVAVLPGLGMGLLISYVVGSPFVLREGYGLSANQFALLFAVNGIALVGGAQINAALVRRIAPIRILRVALPASLTMSVVLLAIALTGFGGLFGLLVALWLLLLLVNFVPPNASAIALNRYGAMAGTAAAFLGSMQTGIAGVVSPLVGVLGGDARAMCLVMVGCAATALAVLALATPAYRRGGWHSL